MIFLILENADILLLMKEFLISFTFVDLQFNIYQNKIIKNKKIYIYDSRHIIEKSKK